MSLPFNIRSVLKLSYFIILFFNYLQGRPGLPSSIHFVIFKNSFLLNHEDPRDVPPTIGKKMMYTIHPWLLCLHVHCPSCPNTLINLAVQNQCLGLTSMTTMNLPRFIPYTGFASYGLKKGYIFLCTCPLRCV
jgi:hypothetical protein